MIQNFGALSPIPEPLVQRRVSEQLRAGLLALGIWVETGAVPEPSP